MSEQLKKDEARVYSQNVHGQPAFVGLFKKSEEACNCGSVIYTRVDDESHRVCLRCRRDFKEQARISAYETKETSCRWI
jgi:hypothetical protein